MLGTFLPKYKLTGDLPYDRQQLLWQKQVTVGLIGSVDRDSQIDEYHTGVARFQHAICHCRSVQRQRLASTSLFFVAADAYNHLFYESFGQG